MPPQTISAGQPSDALGTQMPNSTPKMTPTAMAASGSSMNPKKVPNIPDMKKGGKVKAVKRKGKKS
jgi:hypothetical protein